MIRFSENDETLKYVPDSYKNKKKCVIKQLIIAFMNLFWNIIKLKKCAIKLHANSYLSTIKFIPKCFMTQEMCNKAVNRCFFEFDSIPDQYKTQEMCDEAVDDSLAILKFISDSFVTSKMIKKLFTALYADENILYFH